MFICLLYPLYHHSSQHSISLAPINFFENKKIFGQAAHSLKVQWTEDYQVKTVLSRKVILVCYSPDRGRRQRAFMYSNWFFHNPNWTYWWFSSVYKKPLHTKVNSVWYALMLVISRTKQCIKQAHKTPNDLRLSLTLNQVKDQFYDWKIWFNS